MTIDNVLQLLATLAPILFPAAVAVVTPYVLRAWSQLPTQRQALLRVIAEDVVAAIEQTHQRAPSGVKKADALRATAGIIDRYGVTVPATAMNMAIEAEVEQRNRYAPQRLRPPVTPI